MAYEIVHFLSQFDVESCIFLRELAYEIVNFVEELFVNLCTVQKMPREIVLFLSQFDLKSCIFHMNWLTKLLISLTNRL